jgi:hypothetical protein
VSQRQRGAGGGRGGRRRAAGPAPAAHARGCRQLGARRAAAPRRPPTRLCPIATPPAARDATLYAAACAKLGGARVVLKVYEKARISAAKARSVRREARVMRFVTEARCGGAAAGLGRAG